MGAMDMPQTRAAAALSSGDGRPRLVKVRRFVVDFAVALLLFASFAGLLGVDTGNAFPGPPPPELTFLAMPLPPPEMLLLTPAFPGALEQPNPNAIMILLALAFATLAAANLAIGRHIFSAYVRPAHRNVKGD